MTELQQLINEAKAALQAALADYRQKVKAIIDAIIGLHPTLQRPNWETDSPEELLEFVLAVEMLEGQSSPEFP